MSPRRNPAVRKSQAAERMLPPVFVRSVQFANAKPVRTVSLVEGAPTIDGFPIDDGTYLNYDDIVAVMRRHKVPEDVMAVVAMDLASR